MTATSYLNNLCVFLLLLKMAEMYMY